MINNKPALAATALALALTSGSALAMNSVTLDGQHLTQDQAWAIADGATVKIDAKAKADLTIAHNLLMQAASTGKPIYGLTVGVGLNKDHKLFTADGKLTPAVLEASKSFNYSTLRAHSSAIGAPVPVRLTRVALAVRLNTILSGHTGVQPYVAELYKEYLNKGITPIIPSKGSVGEADILMSSHVGLAMIGEWDVMYKGKRVSSKKAMKAEGIKLLDPIGKDALSILSNNSVAVSYAMQGYRNAQHLLNISPAVFGLSLEGLNGNVAPFLPQTNDIRPFPYLKGATTNILNSLSGSYLWDVNSERPLQDPLSYRTTAYTFASAEKALHDLDDVLTIQINHSDDNPGVIVNASSEYAQTSQVAKYMVGNKGGVIPTTNFEPLPIALAVEGLSVALTHVSHNSVMRTIHLSDSHFTHLSRFLAAPENHGHAFGAIQKTFVDMQVRNKALANPVSFDGIAIAGNIEDTFTNLQFASENLAQIVDNTEVIYGLELMHSAQAIDLRKLKDSHLKMGKATEKMYKSFRKVVPYVKLDRPFTPDIAAATQFIKQF
ncbi:histidine ammonia-lyase [Shewanella intestini]|uniref:Aromatic amino acid lyase n=1 Tax=Shewanella intestini TaxID=2017544 RepID=A0ABS5I3I9_9GAMM|nr:MULTISPECIES: aromatic amino acid ammonia-lyase [Shewanella]MBR9728595.1 aromatic amino acid lyase [Shewanella intestini]MRG37348.1 histidine ammonia-lyase [Shewanella sp. XMDDZSB0408]